MNPTDWMGLTFLKGATLFSGIFQRPARRKDGVKLVPWRRTEQPKLVERYPKARFDVLDGLRGAAAIYVVMYHNSEWFGPLYPKAGFLSVDLFFILSGFVIAWSYEDSLEANLTVAQFIKIRLIRLYPMYFVGIIIAFLPVFLSFVLRGEILATNRAAWIALPFSLLMLPNPFFDDAQSPLYTLNSPAWSLFFELLVNIVYAATVKFWSTSRTVAIVMLSGFLLIVLGSSDGGWNWSNFLLGVPRVCFSFACGLLIFKAYQRGFLAPRIPAAICLVALPVALSIASYWNKLFCVLILLPIIVTFSVASSCDEGSAKICRALGILSYPLYTIHVPLMSLMNNIFKKLSISIDPPYVGVAFLIFILPLSFSLGLWADLRLRKILRNFLIHRNLRNPFAPPER
jgi:peptidoglycan/LPS O-acetylase OafA/YrhL